MTAVEASSAPSSVQLPIAPEPRFVLATDGVKIATYDSGEPDAPAIVAVHGFASSAYANWFATGWVRELTRAGYRVVSMDQRGHGKSGKPRAPGAYSMEQLVADVHTVLDTYLLDDVAVVGYSLGARVGWHASLGSEHRIRSAVLGGIPDGRPLTRFQVDAARAHVTADAPLEDRLTRAYVDMARRSPDNDIEALIALVEGMQHGLQPDPDEPPRQPVLFATGSQDGILQASQRLAASTPRGEFFEIAGRNHFNAPTARSFRDRALAFLGAARSLPASAKEPRQEADPGPEARSVSAWDAGLAAILFATGAQPDGRAGRAGLEPLLRDAWLRWSACLAAVTDDDLG